LRGQGQALPLQTSSTATFVIVALCLLFAPSSVAQQPDAEKAAARTRYRVQINLDVDKRTYTGTLRVRWVNEDDGAAALFFHLYPNLRDASPAGDAAADDETEEPALDILGVRDAAANQPLAFAFEDGRATLRVSLREPVAAGRAADVEIKFTGRFPEIDSDETSLTAHLIKQVGAALHDTAEQRRARDINFTSRGVVLLGAPFPLLAARVGDEWQRRVEPTVGDIVYADAADYEVEIIAPGDLSLFTSATEAGDFESGNHRARYFRGEGLRGFSLVAGRALRVSEREAAGVRVRAVYTAEHERTALRVLEVAAGAVKVFTARFGPLPFKSYTVAEAPLVAGMGSAEFAGLSAIASAFYVDFDSPAMRGLPEIVREQRASVEDSLEFAAAHMAAHQWWGAAVGSDPAREPVLDEALAHWSALAYYRDAHGEERARSALEDQLRGVYQVYRSFGGADEEAGRPAREYRNSFQYAAIVTSKGALMVETVRQLMGERRFMSALRNFYETRRLRTVRLDDLRRAFADETETQRRRSIARVFTRWLSERHGDEDIAPPNAQLAASLGITRTADPSKDANAFARLGKFFWRQMTKVR
jgi:hypothetical protein